MSSVTTLKAIALQSGVPYPGLSAADRKSMLENAAGVEKIREYAGRLEAMGNQLARLRPKLGADARWLNARATLKKALGDLERYNRAATVAAQAALASGDLKPEAVASMEIKGPAGLEGLEALGGLWLVVTGFAAFVVAAILAPAWAPVILAVGASLVTLAALIPQLTALVSAAGGAAESAGKALPSSGGILGLLAVAALVYFAVGGKTPKLGKGSR